LAANICLPCRSSMQILKAGTCKHYAMIAMAWPWVPK
jgi:hypothetical protein